MHLNIVHKIQAKQIYYQAKQRGNGFTNFIPLLKKTKEENKVPKRIIKLQEGMLRK